MTLRPVVSMVGTPEHQLAKFLGNIMKRHIPDTYLLKSTEHFAKEVKKYNFSEKQTIVSFDVVSLFTYVPLNEIIELTIDRLYSAKNETKPQIKKAFFKY